MGALVEDCHRPSGGREMAASAPTAAKGLRSHDRSRVERSPWRTSSDRRTMLTTSWRQSDVPTLVVCRSSFAGACSSATESALTHDWPAPETSRQARRPPPLTCPSGRPRRLGQVRERCTKRMVGSARTWSTRSGRSGRDRNVLHSASLSVDARTALPADTNQRIGA